MLIRQLIQAENTQKVPIIPADTDFGAHLGFTTTSVQAYSQQFIQDPRKSLLKNSNHSHEKPHYPNYQGNTAILTRKKNNCKFSFHKVRLSAAMNHQCSF